MRKVTELAVKAFFNKKAFSLSNTTVFIDRNGTVFMSLHSNIIAMLNTDGRLFISNAGWSTKTTKERLNGILEYCKKNKIYIKNNNLCYKDNDKNIYLNDNWLEI